MDAVRKAQRAYARRWRAMNKDRVRKNNLRYWARRAEREAQELHKEMVEEEKQNERADS